MRILNWVQSKISGRPERKPADVVCSSSSAAVRSHTPDTRKEEFSDWPNGLLAIGTFGSKNLRGGDSQNESVSAISCSSRDENNVTAEEMEMLQHELEDFLIRHEKPDTSNEDDEEKEEEEKSDQKTDLPSSENSRSGSSDVVISLSTNSRVILNRAKDMLAENHNAINQRSVSFLFKKMFSCRSVFSPTLSLRDPQTSIMEKLLKAILHKKIHPQNNTSPALTSRKYLERKPRDEKSTSDKTPSKPEDGSKWVKTDSEYIVLEI